MPPPCCWPATISGFTIRPQSSTATWRSGVTCPVSVSTSTIETWAPNGNVAPSWVKSRVDAEPAVVLVGVRPRARASEIRPRPARRRRRSRRRRARCPRGRPRASGPPRARAWSRISSAALPTALPPSCSEREPPVPPPVRHDSRCRTGRSGSSRSGCRGGRRRSSRTTWRGPGRAPTCRPSRWPSRPSWICTEPNSEPPKPVISTYVATPMPSSLRLAGLDAAPLLGARRVDVGDPQRLLERELVVADVVGLAGQGLVGERVLGDQVAAPDLLGQDAELLGGQVDDPLDRGGRLGPAGAAEGADRARCWSSPRSRRSASSG